MANINVVSKKFTLEDFGRQPSLTIHLIQKHKIKTPTPLSTNYFKIKIQFGDLLHSKQKLQFADQNH